MKFADGEGVKEWYNDKFERHHVLRPALVYEHGDEFWYRNGEFHRLDGPAAVSRHGQKPLWCWLGKDVSEKKHALLSNIRFFTKKVKI